MALTLVPGCGPGRSRTDPAETPSELPPAYTRDRIDDPALIDLRRSFIAWIESLKVGDARTMSRVEVLPLAPTLLPYGIGTYQKESRLPVILVTGPGWERLKPGECEALAKRIFQDLSDRLGALHRPQRIRPTLTIQTALGFELGWINEIESGTTLLHGLD